LLYGMGMENLSLGKEIIGRFLNYRISFRLIDYVRKNASYDEKVTMY